MKYAYSAPAVRCFGVALVFGIGFIVSSTMTARVHAAGSLVTDVQLRHLGLERAWYGQVRLDPARNKVERAVLEGDRLTVLTTAGVVHEFNALTGKTIWIAPVGNPNYPSLGPAGNDTHVAILNGSTLYVLDRADGKPILIRRVGGAPGAAPGVAKNHVFVPLASGRIEAYSLVEQKLTPWYYQSYGRAMVAPLVTPNSFVWTTDAGFFYVGRTDELGMRFRLETGSEIVAPPAYGAPHVIAATSNGEVFSMHELTGQRNWKYSAGFPVARAPAVVGNKVFVTSDEPTLHCIEATTGKGIWEAPKVSQFAAASAKRIYGVDDLGALVVLDANSGTMLGRMPTSSSTDALVNDQTDRVYLVSLDGVVQCFHEIGAKTAMHHRPKPQAEAGASPSAGTSDRSPATTGTPSRPAAEADDDAELPTDGAPSEAAPVGEMDADEPAEDPSLDEDPFADLGE